MTTPGCGEVFPPNSFWTPGKRIRTGISVPPLAASAYAPIPAVAVPPPPLGHTWRDFVPREIAPTPATSDTRSLVTRRACRPPPQELDQISRTQARAGRTAIAPVFTTGAIPIRAYLRKAPRSQRLPRLAMADDESPCGCNVATWIHRKHGTSRCFRAVAPSCGQHGAPYPGSRSGAPRPGLLGAYASSSPPPGKVRLRAEPLNLGQAESGRLTRATVPRPSSLSSARVPPCCSAIHRAIGSPSPVPPGSRTRARSPR